MLWVELPTGRERKHSERRPAVAIENEADDVIPVILLTQRRPDRNRHSIPMSANGLRGIPLEDAVYYVRCDRVIRTLYRVDARQLMELIRSVYI